MAHRRSSLTNYPCALRGVRDNATTGSRPVLGQLDRTTFPTWAQKEKVFKIKHVVSFIVRPLTRYGSHGSIIHATTDVGVVQTQSALSAINWTSKPSVSAQVSDGAIRGTWCSERALCRHAADRIRAIWISNTTTGVIKGQRIGDSRYDRPGGCNAYVSL